MNLYIYPTDWGWFDFLRQKPGLDEVNFWQPGGAGQFRALRPGEPFLFKLHSPRNYIVGGGFFARSSLAPLSLAWDAFEEKNGVSSLKGLQLAIAKYRRSRDQFEDFTIGCIVLQSPFFFEEHSWIPAPRSWSPGLVRGKSFDLASPDGRNLWAQVEGRLPGHLATEVHELASRALLGRPRETRSRLGQGEFRLTIADVYSRACAVTGERALPVLEAAHIQPVSAGGIHRIENGILVRSDLHRLYDRGYVTIDPDHRFVVSSRLKEEFDNGEPYYPLHGARIRLPASRSHWPSPALLQWHADYVFRS